MPDSSPTAVPAVEQEPPSGTIRWCCVKCGESNQQTPAMPFLPCVRCGCTIPLCVAMEPSVQPPTEAGMPEEVRETIEIARRPWGQMPEHARGQNGDAIRWLDADRTRLLDRLAQLTVAHETAVQEKEAEIARLVADNASLIIALDAYEAATGATNG